MAVHNYSKGSLSPTNLRDLLAETDHSLECVDPVFPVFKDALELQAKEEITSIVNTDFSNKKFEVWCIKNRKVFAGIKIKSVLFYIHC